MIVQIYLVFMVAFRERIHNPLENLLQLMITHIPVAVKEIASDDRKNSRAVHTFI